VNITTIPKVAGAAAAAFLLLLFLLLLLLLVLAIAPRLTERSALGIYRVLAAVIGQSIAERRALRGPFADRGGAMVERGGARSREGLESSFAVEYIVRNLKRDNTKIEGKKVACPLS